MRSTHTTTGRRRNPGRVRRNIIIVSSASVLAAMTGYVAHAVDVETAPDASSAGQISGSGRGTSGMGVTSMSGSASAGASASASGRGRGNRAFPQGNGSIPGVRNTNGQFGAQTTGGARGVAVPQLPGTSMSDDLMRNNRDYPGNGGRGRGTRASNVADDGGEMMLRDDNAGSRPGGRPGARPGGGGGSRGESGGGGGLGGLFGGGGGGGGGISDFFSRIMSMFSGMFGGDDGGFDDGGDDMMGGGVSSRAMGGGGGYNDGEVDMDGRTSPPRGSVPYGPNGYELGSQAATNFAGDGTGAGLFTGDEDFPLLENDGDDVYPTSGGFPGANGSGGAGIGVGGNAGRGTGTGTAGRPAAGGVQAPPAQSGGMKDGTFTGPVQSHRFGPVQVSATVQGGRLTAVRTLQKPDSSSARYNDRQIPQLTQKAIAANSATIDSISGATLTSEAFKKSLQGALDQARR